MKQTQVILFFSLCLFMKGCEESSEPETFESSKVESASPPPSQPPLPSLRTCSDILYPGPLPPREPYSTPPTEEECEQVLDCAWSLWPADFYFVNETTMPIRLVYGAYDGSCLPPRLSPDMHIPVDDSLKKHMNIGAFVIWSFELRGGATPLLDSVFLSHTVMVVFNEERYAFHVRNDGCSNRRNLFCSWRSRNYEPRYCCLDENGENEYSKVSFRYVFTEEDYAQATPFPRDP